MKRPDYDRMSSLFRQVLHLSPAEREEFLDRECAAESGLRRELEALLESDQSAEGFLETHPSMAGMSHRLARRFADESIPPRLRAGDRLGDFQVESFLARGGMGEVYRAFQRGLGDRVVALKIMPADASGPRALDRFRREAVITAAVHHPHLVEVYGFGEERGLLYYAMRLVEGPTLAAILGSRAADAAWSPTDLCKWIERAVEVCQALHALHGRGLVHGDVKPANIILEGGDDAQPLGGSAVLVDLGLVRRVDAPQTTTTRLATPSYAAPEKLLGAGDGDIDARADVYSLGWTLHDLLSRQTPEQRPGDGERGPRRLDRLTESAGRDLAAIVRKASDPIRELRYRDGGEMARDLSRWLAGQPVAARRQRPFERLASGLIRSFRGLAGFSARHAPRALWLVVLGTVGTLVAGKFLNAARITRAWDRGDLRAAAERIGDLPAMLDGVLLPGRLSAHAPDLRARGGDGALAEVVQTLRTAGERAATLLAARHIERDGLPDHPALARFLCHLLHPDAGSTAAVEILARLFYERPCRSPAAQAAADPFRSPLLAIVERGLPSDPTHRQALVALSGCARPRDLPLLAPSMFHAGRQDPVDIELLRIAQQAITKVVQRSFDCQTLEELDEGLPALRGGGDLETLPRELLRAIAFADRARDASRGRFLPDDVPGTLSDLVRSAALDPALGEQLPRADILPAELGPALLPWWCFEEYGRRVGSYEDESLVARCRERAAAVAADRGMDGGMAIAGFAAGVTLARQERTGRYPPGEPDVESHLGYVLDHPVASEVPLPVGELTPSRNSHEAFRLRLTGEQPSASFRGERFELTMIDASHRTDSNVPDEGYVHLGVPGRSALRIRYQRGPQVSLPQLLVEVVKGTRWGLPRAGWAAIEVILDGQRIQTAPIAANGKDRFSMSMSDNLAGPGPTYELTLRLHESSTTTVRLRCVEVVQSE